MTSPFKFLDAYGAEDKDSFFGRNAEIAQLYALVMRSPLVLVYGPSGSGKTSLIQCGLAIQFKPTDWFPVFVRRNDNLNTSLFQKINAEAVTPIDPAADIVAATRSLYLDVYQPIYFIFDQFEELFIIGSPEERATFFANIQALLASDVNVRIIISMREEYLAWLQDFERAVPMLFSSRLRIEQMTLAMVEGVIVDMTAKAGITLENGVETARAIVAKIGEPRVAVQLAYMQVYLDKLYREAAKSSTPLLFTDALVAQTGTLGDVMVDFLEEQTQAIADDVRSRHPSLPKGSVHQLLNNLTTDEGTKKPNSRNDLATALPALTPMIDDLLAALENSRIIRRQNDSIELSHDSLARPIAERRSSEEKALARVKKTVQDGFDKYNRQEKNKTYLAAEDLAEVLPVVAKLNLPQDQTAFVEKSRAKLRWRRLRLVGSTAVLIAVLAGFSAYAGFQSERASSAITAASETTGTITSRIATDLKVIEKTQNVRKSLLDDLKSLNSELEAIDPLATADTGFWLAILEGDLLLEDNDIPGARQKFVAALGAAETQWAVLADIPDAATVSPWRRNVAAGASRLAQLELTDGKPDAALKYFLKALAIDEANARALPADMFAQHDLLLSYGNFGSFQRERGQLDSARAYLGKALANASKLEAADPDNREWQRDYGFYLHELGMVERDSGNLDKARTALTAALKRYDAIADSDPARLDWRLDSMWASYDLADVERLAGRWSEALRASDAAYTSLDALSQDSQTEYGPMLKDQRDLINRRDSRVAAPAGNPA